MIIKQVDELKEPGQRIFQFRQDAGGQPDPNNLNEMISRSAGPVPGRPQGYPFRLGDRSGPAGILPGPGSDQARGDQHARQCCRRHGGGTVTIESHYSQELQMVSFIADDGCGIPAEDKPRLFRALFFHQKVGHRPGTGHCFHHHHRSQRLYPGQRQPAQRHQFIVELPVAEIRFRPVVERNSRERFHHEEEP
jgi:hypothetical protein